MTSTKRLQSWGIYNNDTAVFFHFNEKRAYFRKDFCIHFFGGGGRELIFGLVLSLGGYYRNITVVNYLVPYS